jgi:hypothetical protein
MNKIFFIFFFVSAISFGCSDNGKKSDGGDNGPGGILAAVYVDAKHGSDNHAGDSWDNAVRTIAKGINLATQNGAVVYLAAGTYKGTGDFNLDFNGKNIHLTSVSGPENCIIDCQGYLLDYPAWPECGFSRRAFYFHSGETDQAIVEGITIVNARTYEGDGGGIHISGASPVIKNCIIRNCMVTCTVDLIPRDYNGEGGGVRAGGGLVIDCIIENNTGILGAGLFLGGTARAVNCLIDGNYINGPHGGIGAGIYATDFAQVVNCTVVDNYITQGSISFNMCGGGIAACSFAVVNNTLIWNNILYVYDCVGMIGGSQLYVYSSGNVGISHCQLPDNDGDIYGISVSAFDNCVFDAPVYESGYIPAAGSAGVDKGSEEYLTGITEDLAGNPRKHGDAVDIGVYERQD